MPTYSYECPTGHRYTETRSITEPTSSNCPECNEPSKQIYNAPPVVLKGSGFYSNDK